jgi:hypothetical protein
MIDIDRLTQKLMRDWLLFLDNLSIENGGDIARDFWVKLVHLFPNAMAPVFIPFEDGSGVQFVWDNGNHHLDIDVLAAEAPDWFYRNRAAFDIHTAGESVDSGYGIDTVEFRKYFELMIPQ